MAVEMMPAIPATEGTVPQFNRLMQELLNGGVRRNHFQPWEVRLLLDMESCDVPRARRFEILRRYQRAVNRAYEDGATEILTLSNYLLRKRGRESRRVRAA
jgi:hypothetical protein